MNEWTNQEWSSDSRWDNQVLSSRNMEIRDARQPLLALALEVIKSQSRAAVLGCVHSLTEKQRQPGCWERRKEQVQREKQRWGHVALATQTEWPQFPGLLGPRPRPFRARLSLLSLDPVRQPNTHRMHLLCTNYRVSVTCNQKIPRWDQRACSFYYILLPLNKFCTYTMYF